jgi:hypothetical protein
LVNIDSNFLNKIFSNLIQEHIRKIIHHDQNGLNPRMQCQFNMCKLVKKIQHVKNNQRQNYMNISIDGGRGLDKIHFIFLIKALKKEGVGVIYLNIIKVIYNKL